MKLFIFRHVHIFFVLLILNQNIDVQQCMHVKNHHHHHTNYFYFNYLFISIRFVTYNVFLIDNEKSLYFPLVLWGLPLS
jgi:hypothetical protein